jgi:Glycosyl hydrolase family 63 N-terminal domain/Glycosyl hydrolase family 63 C-terminal domain
MILTGAVIMGFLAICLYCSTLFLNQRSSTKAALAVDSAACQEASDWSSNHRYDITSTASLPLWGSYRPGIYFGMKTRSPIALSTGILWVGSNTRRNGLRHDTNQDELTQFEWIVHDGKHYGRQTLTDESYKMELSTTFIVKEVSNISVVDSAALKLKINQDSSWIQRIEVRSLYDDEEYDRQKSLFFYVGFEGAEHDELERSTFITDMDFIESTKILLAPDQFEETAPQLFTVIGRSKASGYFRLVLTAKISEYDKAEAKKKGRSESDVSISFVGLSSGDVTRSVNELKESHSTLQYIRDNDDNNAFLKNGNLKNSIEDKSNFLVIQVKSDINFTLDAVLYEHLPVENVDQLKLLAVSEMERYVKDFLGKNQKDVTESATISSAFITQEIVSGSKIDSWISYYETNFEQKFDAVYKLNFQMNEKNKSVFSAVDIEASRRALSSLLGGIGYFYGSPK